MGHRVKHHVFRWHALSHAWRHIWTEESLAILLAVFIFVMPVSASTRFVERSLFMHSATPGATTKYTVTLTYVTPAPVGSLDMLFCVDPIPHHPCEVPPGLDVSNATLVDQTGETGFTISEQTTNHIVLSRLPSMITSGGSSSYTFDNIVNPTNVDQSFSIRLRSHSSTDASGPQIDFGSVKGQVTEGIQLYTQVPPMLIFCFAQEVEVGCTDTNDTYYTDMGELDENSTLVAYSQMAVGTNATAGFSITAHGSPPAAGTSIIDPIETPSPSIPGTNQFGINLVANSNPAIGNNPEGPFANAIPAADYGTPDLYKFVDGDEVAFSPNVSLMRKFTVSYILNSSPDLRPGVYSTTITFIASGRF